MPTLRQIREDHFISRKRLAMLSGTSESTIIRMEEGKKHTNEDTVNKVLDALSKAIGQKITVDTIEGLNKPYNPMRDRSRKPKEENIA